jgi:RNA polymerase sigma-70 factor (ECF subfamily)
VVRAQSLWSRCIGGEERAWRELHAEYYPLAYAFLRRMGVRPADLDDTCQEVFVQVFRYLARFEQRADFKTWLYKLCISQAARARRRAALAAFLRQVLGPTVAEAHEWTESEAQRRVHAALARMKEIHRAVFVLFELEGLSGEDIARILNVPFGTVRRRLHSARAEFAARVEEGSLVECR